MANIGKRALHVNIVNNISRQLLESFAGSDKRISKALVRQLLSHTERVLLAKRLAAILMLIDEQSYYRIHQVLGMSVSTTRNLHRQLLAGEYSDIEAHMFRKKERERITKQIGLLLRGGLPPRAYVIKKRRK